MITFDRNTHAWIAKHVGMDSDELLRLKQVTGIAALFTRRGFGKAWVPTEADAAEYDVAI